MQFYLLLDGHLLAERKVMLPEDESELPTYPAGHRGGVDLQVSLNGKPP